MGIFLEEISRGFFCASNENSGSRGYSLRATCAIAPTILTLCSKRLWSNARIYVCVRGCVRVSVTACASVVRNYATATGSGLSRVD